MREGSLQAKQARGPTSRKPYSLQKPLILFPHGFDPLG